MPKTKSSQFNYFINIKSAVANAAGMVVFMIMLGFNDTTILTAAGLFGAAGGSVNDVLSFRRNITPKEENPDEN